MKKFFLLVSLFVTGAVLLSAQTHSHGGLNDPHSRTDGIDRMRPFAVEEYTGVHWTVLLPEEKLRIVGGVLAGFSMWRDYIFDLDEDIYDRYEAYDEFLGENGVTQKVVNDIDRYYALNRSNYKFEDRVVNLVIVFYGKYWWR